MNKRAGKSNLQTNTSFRKKIAKPTWKRIAVAELNERSTMSAKGVAPNKVDTKYEKFKVLMKFGSMKRTISCVDWFYLHACNRAAKQDKKKPQNHCLV